MRKRTIVALAMLAVACYGKHGSSGRSIGPAWLETVYLRYRIPAVHLLFVADVGAPGSRGGWAGNGSFGSWDAEVRQSYTDAETGTTIEGRPVVIRGTTLRADGRSFDLTRGNVLVIHMRPGGSLNVTQLPERRGANEPARELVALVKASLPRDERVQALRLDG